MTTITAKKLTEMLEIQRPITLTEKSLMVEFGLALQMHSYVATEMHSPTTGVYQFVGLCNYGSENTQELDKLAEQYFCRKILSNIKISEGMIQSSRGNFKKRKIKHGTFSVKIKLLNSKSQVQLEKIKSVLVEYALKST